MEQIIRQTLVAWFCDRANASSIVEFEFSQKLFSKLLWERAVKIGNETLELKLFKVLQHISDVRWLLTLIRGSKLSFVNEGSITTSSYTSTHTTLKWTVQYNRIYSTRPRSIFNRRLFITKFSKRHGWFSIRNYNDLQYIVHMYETVNKVYEFVRIAKKEKFRSCICSVVEFIDRTYFLHF